jgi:hypothetical protein
LKPDTKDSWEPTTLSTIVLVVRFPNMSDHGYATFLFYFYFGFRRFISRNSSCAELAAPFIGLASPPQVQNPKLQLPNKSMASSLNAKQSLVNSDSHPQSSYLLIFTFILVLADMRYECDTCCGRQFVCATRPRLA